MGFTPELILRRMQLRAKPAQNGAFPGVGFGSRPAAPGRRNLVEPHGETPWRERRPVLAADCRCAARANRPACRSATARPARGAPGAVTASRPSFLVRRFRPK